MSEITLRIDRPVYRTKSGPVMRVLSEFYMFPFNRTLLRVNGFWQRARIDSINKKSIHDLTESLELLITS